MTDQLKWCLRLLFRCFGRFNFSDEKFVESVICNFLKMIKWKDEDDYIILLGPFDIVKPIIVVEFPFCTKDEAKE